MHRLLTVVLALALTATSFAQGPNPNSSITLPSQMVAGATNNIALNLPSQGGQTVSLTMLNTLTGQSLQVEVSLPDDGNATVPVLIPAGWNYCQASVPNGGKASGPVYSGPQAPDNNEQPPKPEE